MSCIAFAPLREIAIDSLQVRQHRSLFMHNHLPKQSSAQASWWCPKKLAPKPLAPSNRWTIALLMTTSVRKIPAPGTSATPLAINPVQCVAGSVAPRAREPRPDPALPPAHGRHGPLAQDDLNLDPARLDHNHASAGPGKPRMEGVGWSIGAGGFRSGATEAAEGIYKSPLRWASQELRGFEHEH
jgi:hypothetical protein